LLCNGCLTARLDLDLDRGHPHPLQQQTMTTYNDRVSCAGCSGHLHRYHMHHVAASHHDRCPYLYRCYLVRPCIDPVRT
jgi:hypothetical protein